MLFSIFVMWWPAAAASAAGAAPAPVEWVAIPGGTFQMGSDDGPPEERPRHAVKVKSFYLARTEVTFGQYRTCVKAGACTPAHVSDKGCLTREGNQWAKADLPLNFQADDQPVVCVDWNQAAAFARWAGGRLPTEAEWEYAARGEAGRKYPWGDEPATCERAVLNDGGYGCGRVSTWPVCSKKKGVTPQGLCDMAGNVWEWTQDWYHPSYRGAPAEGGAWEHPPGTLRSRRGGAWRFDAAQAQSSRRRGDTPAFRGRGQGLRPARD